MQSRSIARELALLVLSQVSEQETISALEATSIEVILQKALDSLLDHWREVLDDSASELEIAQQHLLESELENSDKNSKSLVRDHLTSCLSTTESLLNSLSSSLELPQLLFLSDQKLVRQGVMKRVSLVLEQRKTIDEKLDSVMEGWRLKRLPRIDRDILRLAVIDLINLDTPPAVACNEAVSLANRYSDEQGRRMINGILRRLQNSSTTTTI